MNNKIVSRKNTSAIFLAVVLVAGIIAILSPSFIVGAQASSDYGMDNDYKDSYGKDSYKSQYSSYGKDNYKSKDSSSAIVKKVKCNNINVNVNGLELNGLPPALTNLLIDGEADNEGKYGASSYGSGEQSGYYNNNFKFVCINNNNNTVVVGEEPPAPVPPVEDGCAEAGDIEDCFEQFSFEGQFEILSDALESQAGLTVEINGEDITLRSFEDICEALKGLTYEQLGSAVIAILTEAIPGELPIHIILIPCIAQALSIPLPDT